MIVLNGTASAGKTSIAHAVQDWHRRVARPVRFSQLMDERNDSMPPDRPGEPGDGSAGAQGSWTGEPGAAVPAAQETEQVRRETNPDQQPGIPDAADGPAEGGD